MPEKKKVIKEKYWVHKKYKRYFKGKYETDSQGERIFVLQGLENKLSYKRIVFESWQSARNNGWELKLYTDI